MLHHLGMLWIIETYAKLQYDMDKYNSDWMAGSPWHRWELPVLHYHEIMVTYPYPFFVVITQFFF